MSSPDYQERRSQLAQYFDRTAFEAWRRMTSDAPLSRVRTTVREGREMMRATLLERLPEDLAGKRVLDAGCGTGRLAVDIANRGAEVIGVDLSPNLIEIARGRTEHSPGETGMRGTVAYLSGDMLDPSLGQFDHVVAMDSLIHYGGPDVVDSISQLAKRTRRSIVLTFVPRTLALSLMHRAGKLFPRSDRAPAIEPIRQEQLLQLIANRSELSDWQAEPGPRISHGFYTSQAIALTRRAAHP